MYWGDYDGDGDLDIVLFNSLTSRNELFRNDGGFTYTSVTDTSLSSANQDSTGAAWADLDNDGDLDAIIVQNNAALEVHLFEHCSGVSARLGTSHACVSIPAYGRKGTFSDQAFECSPHMTGSPNPTVCVNCPPGLQRDLGEGACSECPVGTAQTSGRATQCEICQPGSYVDFIGSIRCFPCAPGSHSPNSSAATCTPCAIGSYSANQGASSCSPCPIGGFCASVGAASASMTFEQCPGKRA